MTPNVSQHVVKFLFVSVLLYSKVYIISCYGVLCMTIHKQSSHPCCLKRIESIPNQDLPLYDRLRYSHIVVGYNIEPERIRCANTRELNYSDENSWSDGEVAWENVIQRNINFEKHHSLHSNTINTKEESNDKQFTTTAVVSGILKASTSGVFNQESLIFD